MNNVIRSLIERFKKESTVTPQMLMQMDGMAERNAKRIERIKQEMGKTYILGWSM